MASSPWPPRLLVVSGLTLLAIYAGFWLSRYPLLRHYATPLLDLGKLSGYDAMTGGTVAGVFGIAVLAHAVALWAARALTVRAVGPLLAVSLMMQLLLAGVYPVVAADVFNYLLQGRLLAIHRLNPLTAMPKDATADLWLPYSAYPDIQLAYGPVWAWLSAAIAGLTPESLLLGLLGFKALAIVANVVNTGLIVAIVRRLDARAVAVAVVTYAWSPLVLFETVANAHNDGLIATPMLLAAWLVLRGGRPAILAPAAVMLAALMKYAPIIVLPTLLLGLWHAPRLPTGVWRKIGWLGASLTLAGSVTVLAYLPHWAGLATFAGVRRQANELTTSLAAVIAASGIVGLPLEQWVAAARLAAGIGLLAVAWWRRPRDAPATPAAMFDVLLVQLMIGTFWLQPWYVVPLVAFGAASASPWRSIVASVFAASATGSYIVYFYLWTTTWWGTLGRAEVQALAAAVTYLPPLIVLGVVWWHRHTAPSDDRAAPSTVTPSSP